MKQTHFLLPLALIIAAPLGAVVLYQQSFEYGGSILDFGSDLAGDGWTDTTGVIDYDPSKNLTYAGIQDNGGGLYYNFGSDLAGARSATQALGTNIDFGSYSASDEFWFFAIGEMETAPTTSTWEVTFNAGSVVNELTFGFNGSSGEYYAVGFGSGSSTVSVTGGSFTAGDTVAFLARAVKGSGTSPSNSSIEFWFNPDLTNLGPADGSISASKFGRDGAGNAINSVTYGGQMRAGLHTWDEVGVATDLADIVVPEPSTYALLFGFLAFGGVMLKRRLRNR